MWELMNLLLAVTVFVGTHFFFSLRAVRPGLVRRWGEARFVAFYSLLSVFAMLWMITAYVQRPPLPLWVAPTWLNYLPVTVMPVALYLILGGYLCRNPMAVGQQRAFDQEELPGVLRITRHPILWGVAIWACSHLLVNGELGSVILFGSLMLLALAGAVHIDHRRRQAYPARFSRFAAETSFLPLAALVAGRARFTLDQLDWRPFLAALAAYIFLLMLHRPVIGVSPWPV